jgi:hypothetical protein
VLELLGAERRPLQQQRREGSVGLAQHGEVPLRLVDAGEAERGDCGDERAQHLARRRELEPHDVQDALVAQVLEVEAEASSV